LHLADQTQHAKAKSKRLRHQKEAGCQGGARKDTENQCEGEPGNIVAILRQNKLEEAGQTTRIRTKMQTRM